MCVFEMKKSESVCEHMVQGKHARKCLTLTLCVSSAMPRLEALAAALQQRLAAAAADILRLVQGTVAEYEEQLRRQQKLLDAVFKPEVRVQRLGESTTVTWINK